MDASCGLLRLSLIVIAVVAHVLSVVLLVRVRADEKLLQLEGVEGHWVHAV